MFSLSIEEENDGFLFHIKEREKKVKEIDDDSDDDYYD